MSYCNNKECAVSTGIHEGLTFGWGRLDQYGYWEFPCFLCAREHEKRNVNAGPCWPYEGLKWDQAAVSKELDEYDREMDKLEAEYERIRSWSGR